MDCYKNLWAQNWEGKEVTVGGRIGIVGGRGRAETDVVGKDEDNLNISNNNAFPAYSWQSDNIVKEVISSITEPNKFQDLILDSGVKPGDFIQLTGSNFNSQHTMIVGKIDGDGIWVFDSNYVATKTPGYHKIFFKEFNKATAFTVYRIKE